DLERARAIYEWIVDNTFRDPNVQGCGVGDVRFMLESNSLGGKCADLNALFVGLARAAGLPARGVYGLRVAPPPQGYRTLGGASGGLAQRGRRVRRGDEGAALPRRGLPHRVRMATRQSGGRAAGRPRGTAGQSRDDRSARHRGAGTPVRFMGDELDRLQLRAR